MATLFLKTMQTPPRASARASAHSVQHQQTDASRQHGKLESHRGPPRADLGCQASMTTFLFQPIQKPPHASARARRRIVCNSNTRTGKDSMLNWKHPREPLRAHFSSQTNMATLLFQTRQKPPRASARASAHCLQHRQTDACKPYFKFAIAWGPRRCPL